MPKPGGTVARGYGAAHRQERARWAPIVAAGGAVCARCGGLILPGSRWDLDHTPDRTGYNGPAHRYCNRAAGARTGNANRRRRRAVVRTWGSW